MWDLIVSVPDHCLSFYFTRKASYHHHRGFESQKLVVYFYVTIHGHLGLCLRCVVVDGSVVDGNNGLQNQKKTKCLG